VFVTIGALVDVEAAVIAGFYGYLYDCCGSVSILGHRHSPITTLIELA
jgi:hypothetical protein